MTLEEAIQEYGLSEFLPSTGDNLITICDHLYKSRDSIYLETLRRLNPQVSWSYITQRCEREVKVEMFLDKLYHTGGIMKNNRDLMIQGSVPKLNADTVYFTDWTAEYRVPDEAVAEPLDPGTGSAEVRIMKDFAFKEGWQQSSSQGKLFAAPLAAPPSVNVGLPNNVQQMSMNNVETFDGNQQTFENLVALDLPDATQVTPTPNTMPKLEHVSMKITGNQYTPKDAMPNLVSVWSTGDFAEGFKYKVEKTVQEVEYKITIPTDDTKFADFKKKCDEVVSAGPSQIESKIEALSEYVKPIIVEKKYKVSTDDLSIEYPFQRSVLPDKKTIEGRALDEKKESETVVPAVPKAVAEVLKNKGYKKGAEVVIPFSAQAIQTMEAPHYVTRTEDAEPIRIKYLPKSAHEYIQFL